MTSHPKDLSNEVIDAVAANAKVCNNIHLPVQSGSTEILRRMNRHYTREQYLDLVQRIRAKIPDVGITTDIMVGFPGETEQDFEDTLDLVRKAKYSSAFCFVYSRRKGTPGLLDGQPNTVCGEEIPYHTPTCLPKRSNQGNQPNNGGQNLRRVGRGRKRPLQGHYVRTYRKRTACQLQVRKRPNWQVCQRAYRQSGFGYAVGYGGRLVPNYSLPQLLRIHTTGELNWLNKRNTRP